MPDTTPRRHPDGPLNPALGVLNLIDPGHEWPERLDTAGVANLHVWSAAMLDRLRASVHAHTPAELARPWEPEDMPGLTAELVIAQRLVAARRFVEPLRKRLDLYGASDSAVETAITIGMACRNALLPFDVPGPLYDDLARWEDRLEDAAIWSQLANRPTTPQWAELHNLLFAAHWVIRDGAGHENGDRVTMISPRRQGPFDDNGKPLLHDRLVITRSGPDRVLAFEVNGHVMTWRGLCTAMTNGTWLPLESPADAGTP